MPGTSQLAEHAWTRAKNHPLRLFGANQLEQLSNDSAREVCIELAHVRLAMIVEGVLETTGSIRAGPAIGEQRGGPLSSCEIDEVAALYELLANPLEVRCSIERE